MVFSALRPLFWLLQGHGLPEGLEVGPISLPAEIDNRLQGVSCTARGRSAGATRGGSCKDPGAVDHGFCFEPCVFNQTQTESSTFPAVSLRYLKH